MNATTAGVRHWELRHVGERPPTMNQHRRLHPMARAKIDEHWRTTFADIARNEHVPHLRRAKITALPLHANRRSPQDVAACAPAVKAAIDGLVDAHVLDDDGPAQLIAIVFLPPHIGEADGLLLSVREAS